MPKSSSAVIRIPYCDSQQVIPVKGYREGSTPAGPPLKIFTRNFRIVYQCAALREMTFTIDR